MVNKPMSLKDIQQFHKDLETRGIRQPGSVGKRPAPQPQKSAPRVQESSSGNGFFKGLLLLITGGTLVWGGQKYLQSRADQNKEDKALNQPKSTMCQTLSGLQQEVKPAPEPEQPMTLDQQIRMAELTRDKKMKECSARGDNKGIARAQKEFEDCVRSLRGLPTTEDAKTLVRDTRDVARDAADISGSVAVIAANKRSAAASTDAMRVDVERHNAQVAAARASSAISRNTETKANVDTARVAARGQTAPAVGTLQGVQDVVREVKHNIQEFDASVKSVERLRKTIRHFGE